MLHCADFIHTRLIQQVQRSILNLIRQNAAAKMRCSFHVAYNAIERLGTPTGSNGRAFKTRGDYVVESSGKPARSIFTSVVALRMIGSRSGAAFDRNAPFQPRWWLRGGSEQKWFWLNRQKMFRGLGNQSS